MKNTNSMASRLKQARKDAGFKTATAAIDMLMLNPSTYRAHENGQNNFNVAAAEKYAHAYGVTAAWLLIGDDIFLKTDAAANGKSYSGCKKNECPGNPDQKAVHAAD